MKFFFILGFVLCCCVSLRGQDSLDDHHARVSGQAGETYGSGSNFLLDFYQDWISPVKGGNTCPMYPSCSQYSKMLFDSLPVYEAYIGTFERLLRCGHELPLYNTVAIDNGIRWYDSPFSDQYIGRRNRDNNTTDAGLRTPSEYRLRADSGDGKFADYLFSQKDYSRAATEYMRLNFLENDSLKKLSYLRKVGLCYYYDNDNEGYIKYLTAYRTTLNADKSIRAEMELLLGKVYYRTQNYPKAISTLEWNRLHSTESWYDESQFTIGLSYARMFQWESASSHFMNVHHSSDRGQISRRLLDSVDRIRSLPKRQPWLAGTLSAIVPGSGYLYANRPGTALSSFLINGLLIWAMRDAIHQENYSLATVIGFFGSGWYIGNIKGSSDAAEEYNIRIRNSYLDEMLEGVDVDIDAALE
ncbi:MAG: membrane protein insertion efficiency factor YidD [Bacteroidetes bacterium]|nr:MAG: membrane protein insertion efficiency factor YidD [Bacteroidota bacterium]